MTIMLKEITIENFIDAMKLEVKEDQTNFVASNAASIAQSKFHTFLECYGIYDEEKMVGFSAFGKNPEDGTIWIVRHMVDKNLQGKGYGKSGLKSVIKFLKNKYSCSEIYLDVVEENKVATNLYVKTGFKATGNKNGNSPIYKLDLTEYSEE
ncbi:MAG: GNAT family N-acetyltransferase [Candidatus Heimdallarchaeota archaeon]|nr:GNAT family N-acetyltransferase [Candidatus Heimdallarchaeota archaeon]MCK5297587.1 GNAT family N-acetyltransferase [Candidatus Heimdallarchaeota archaeon]